MVLWRIIYPAMEDLKLMRIYDIVAPDILQVPRGCTKIVPEEWASMLESAGGVEQDLLGILGVTEVQDMR